ncbi:MAG: glutathione S-transferase family protein [Rhodocyclaceae bacterium]|nr:glutathione S-transferase family protein [Rhodocyclaceae bacterium]
MPTQPELTLISHVLCPYVQRAAILLAEKGVPFQRIDIDLANKPDWFLALSPLGKVPVLRVGDTAVFESAVIAEYLDETQPPRLHPADPLERARHRSWIEFGSTVLADVWGFYTAPTEAELQARAGTLAGRFRQLESVLGDGPWFAGASFGLVDAAFGPVFRYFDVFDTIDDFGMLDGCPRVAAWRRQLAARPSVQGAVRPDYADRLRDFIAHRQSALARRLEATQALA